MTKWGYDPGKCLCSGETHYYDGALGYEAMVCQTCHEHYMVGQSLPAHHAHVERYNNGVRNNWYVKECCRSACKANLEGKERYRIWNNPGQWPPFRDYCMNCGSRIMHYNKGDEIQLKHEVITCMGDHVMLVESTNPFKVGDKFVTTTPVDIEVIHWPAGTILELSEIHFDGNLQFSEAIRHLMPNEVLWYVFLKDGAHCAFKPDDFFGDTKRFERVEATDGP